MKLPSGRTVEFREPNITDQVWVQRQVRTLDLVEEEAGLVLVSRLTGVSYDPVAGSGELAEMSLADQRALAAEAGRLWGEAQEDPSDPLPTSN